MADIGTLQATLGLKTTPLEKARSVMGSFARDADRQMGNAENATNKLGSAFTVLGGTIATALSVRQIIRFSKTAVSEFAKVQQAIANASTLFHGIAVDTDNLQAQIYTLSSATGLAADEIGQSLYQALSAGIAVTEDMTDAITFLSSTSKLAKAGFTDMTTAVEATAKTLNAYRMDVSEAEKIHRILMQTQNRGITTVDELGSYLAMVTPIAASFGVSFENVGAALSTMTAQGVRSRIAITQLRQLIVELGKSGTEGSEALLRAAKNAGLAQMSFTQFMQSGYSLGEVLNILRKYADDTGQSVVDMFGSVEAGQAVLALTGKNAEYMSMVFGEMAEDSDLVGESYSRVMGTLREQSAIARNNFKLLQSTVGEMLAPALLDVVSRMNEWLIANREFLSQNMSTYADNIAKAVKFVADNLDKVVFFVKGLVAMKLYTWLITATTGTYGFATALGVATTAAKMLGRALLFGFIVEGIQLLLEGFGKINEMVNNTPLTWGAAARVAGDAFINGLINAIRALVLILPKLLNDIIVRPIAESLSSLFSAKTITSIIQGKPLDVLYDMAEAHADEVGRVLEEAGDRYQEIANDRLIKLASPEDMAAWGKAITWSPEPWAPDVPEVPDAPEFPTVDPDVVGDGMEALQALQKQYLTSLAADYQNYQNELTLMDYEGVAQRKKSVDLWAESLRAEIENAGAWSDAIGALIDDVVDKRKELIDAEHRQDATSVAEEAKTALAWLQAETDIMKQGPTYWNNYQAQKEGNAELEKWVDLLKEAEVSQKFIEEFTNQFNLWTTRNKEAQTAMERWEDISKRVADTVSGAFDQMTDRIIDNLMNGKAAFEDFGDFVEQIFAQVLKQFIVMTMLNPLNSGIESLMLKLFPSAQGNAFDSQRNVLKFATGGVVTRPTIFPFASGTGLMGEAGPEAILPLSRINGELGVKAVGGGGGGVVVNVNNQGNPLKVESQSQRRGPDGNLIIDLSVRSALDRLDGQGALDSMFTRHGASRKGTR